MGPCWETFEPERLTQFPASLKLTGLRRDKQTFGHELKVLGLEVGFVWPTENQSSQRVRMYKIEILEAVSLGVDCRKPRSPNGERNKKAMGNGQSASIRSNRPSCSLVVLCFPPAIPKKTGLAYVDVYHSFRDESLEPAVVVPFPANLF